MFLMWWAGCGGDQGDPGSPTDVEEPSWRPECDTGLVEGVCENQIGSPLRNYLDIGGCPRRTGGDDLVCAMFGPLSAGCERLSIGPGCPDLFTALERVDFWAGGKAEFDQWITPRLWACSAGAHRITTVQSTARYSEPGIYRYRIREYDFDEFGAMVHVQEEQYGGWRPVWCCDGRFPVTIREWGSPVSGDACEEIVPCTDTVTEDCLPPGTVPNP